MKFEEYCEQFIKEAKMQDYSTEYIERCLRYASNLNCKSIPVIYDQEHLAHLLGVHPAYLYAASNSQVKFYRKFKIKKNNGKYRIIYEPLPILKDIQKWILNEILNKLDVSIYTKAYKKKSSIKDNAKFHRNQKKVACLDIENYFASIKEWDIYLFCINLGYTSKVSMMLTKLCTLNHSLPQGAPTSPVLSNLLTVSLDEQLYKLANKLDFKARYTRYADDITFSGDFNPSQLIKEVNKIINLHKFKLNKQKVRVISSNKRQLVTGIVVNKKLQVSKKKRRELRQIIYYIDKFKLESHLQRIKWKKSKISYIRHLIGIVNFILFINPHDKVSMQHKFFLIERLKEQKI